MVLRARVGAEAGRPLLSLSPAVLARMVALAAEGHGARAIFSRLPQDGRPSLAYISKWLAQNRRPASD